MSFLNKKLVVYCFIIFFLIIPTALSKNIRLTLNRTYPETLFGYESSYGNNLYLDTNSTEKNPKIFFSLAENSGEVQHWNLYFNETIGKANSKRANLMGVCRHKDYFYSYDEWNDAQKLVKIPLDGGYDYIADNPNSLVTSCTKNYLWGLASSAFEPEKVFRYDYNGTLLGSCKINNDLDSGGGFWMESNEKYFWAAKAKSPYVSDYWLYRYYYNKSSDSCELKENISAVSVGIKPSDLGYIRGIAGNIYNFKMWIGLSDSDYTTKDPIYEFNIKKGKINSPPTATKPYIIKTSQQNLLCKTNVSDPDNDSVNVSYSWFINGEGSSIDTKILPKAEFKRTDEIICQVRPYDGKLYGEVKNSSIHILQPKLPKGKVLIITNTSWKNILSVSNLNKPTIVSDEINENVKHFIGRYEPGKIYIIGNVQYEINKYDITKISDLDKVQEVLYSNKGGILVDSVERGIVSSGLASLLRKPLVFSEDDNISIDLRNKTNDEILGKYLDEVDKRGKNINYLVVSSKKYPFAGVLTARNGAYPVLIPEYKLDNTEFIRGEINEAVEKLNKKNFYVESPKYPLNGAYMLLSGGIRSIKKEDPVENLLVFNDPLDGESFRSDLEYGDLNNNDVIDVSVGRLPKDETLSSLIFARKYLNTNDKKALVASEYLYTAWPVILTYIGGGMFNGKTIANILRRQDYNVSRLVEQRARPIKFLTGLAPVSIKNFLDESKKIGNKVSSLIGKNIGKAISKVLVSIKALKYVEEGLELYLEYEWNSFGPKLSNAKEVAKSIVMTREKTPQKIAAKLVYILWPNPYPKLNKENLKSELKDADLIYYEGIGNGTKWILPNPIGRSGYMDWQEFLKERYSGENTFPYKEIPKLKSRLVWDNSNLATKKNKKMWREFLERGSATYIGASGVNYAPYSSEIDSRFFRGGGTIGKALKNSVNSYHENHITYDPFNMAIRGGEIKAKTLREFILYGDPSLRKNPIIKADNATETDVECNGKCHLTVKIKTPHRNVSNNKTRTIITSSSDYLTNAFEPIIPIKKFDYYLPHKAQILDYEIKSNEEKYENITFPTINPLSHGNTYINKTLDEGIYPQKTYRLNISKTIDGRTKIQLVHSLIQYNRESKVAKVFDKIELQIDYETPIEMYILPGNVRSRKIKIKLINNKERKIKGKLYTKVINQTGNKLIERNFILEPKSSNIVKIDSNQNRKFLVKALASTDAFNLGPRKEIFDLKKKIDFGPIDYLKISSEEILKVYKALRGKIIKYFKPSKEKTQIEEPKSKFVEKLNDNKKVIKIFNSDFKLVITKNKDKVVNNLTSSQGNLLIIERHGNTIEKVKGNKAKLESQYKLAKELIKEKIKEN